MREEEEEKININVDIIFACMGVEGNVEGSRYKKSFLHIIVCWHESSSFLLTIFTAIV